MAEMKRPVWFEGLVGAVEVVWIDAEYHNAVGKIAGVAFVWTYPEVIDKLGVLYDPRYDKATIRNEITALAEAKEGDGKTP